MRKSFRIVVKTLKGLLVKGKTAFYFSEQLSFEIKPIKFLTCTLKIFSNLSGIGKGSKVLLTFLGLVNFDSKRVPQRKQTRTWLFPVVRIF